MMMSGSKPHLNRMNIFSIRLYLLCKYGSISFLTRSGPIRETMTRILFIASVRTITSGLDVSCRKKSNGDKSPAQSQNKQCIYNKQTISDKRNDQFIIQCSNSSPLTA